MKVATWTRDQLRRKLRREGRIAANNRRHVSPDRPALRGYLLGRSEMCANLIAWLDQKPKGKT